MKYDTHTIVTTAKALSESCRESHGEGNECWTGRHVNHAINVLEYLEDNNFDLIKVRSE